MSNPPSAYDLHSHSTCSDGVLRPAEVVQRAAQRGVRALALTDHDEVSGVAEARAAAFAASIELIAGVEISTSWHGEVVHVLGLGVDPTNEILLSGLTVNRSGRGERAERIAAALEQLGIKDALAGARRFVTNPDLVSRTHFARFLVETGHARNAQAVFDRYLGAGKPGYVPHVWASIEDATHWIRVAGGVAVLAHPGRYSLDEAAREALLREFAECGGAGIEVISGSHTPDQYGYWAKRAKQFGFAASMGSDFHGPRESYRDLGDLPPLPHGLAPIWAQF